MNEFETKLLEMLDNINDSLKDIDESLEGINLYIFGEEEMERRKNG